MGDRVGQQLGNYRLIRLLGRGGFAEVYLGEHIRLGTHVAVKILYTRLASSLEVESFEKEARTIAHLSHPHIVRVFDFDVQDDTPFLVMDYAVGGTLRQRHPKGGILSLTMIVTYVKQVADALQYAHDHRLVHRDVKPGNMLLGQGNDVLLSDFGIATIAHHTSSQSTQAMTGTVPYMAPEQAQGKPRPASDQYSLAIVVYEWLSGSCPFTGTVTEIAMQHMLAPVPSLRARGLKISPEVEQVVLTALAKDPKQRFESVQAFARKLEEISAITLMTPEEQWLREGVAHYEARHYEEAIRAYDQALKFDPSYAAIYHNRGKAYKALQQYDRAIADYNQSLTLDPNNARAYSARGNAHSAVALRHYEKAIADYNQALKRGIPRRTFVVGLGVAGLAVAGGGLTWLLSSRTSHLTQTPHPTQSWYNNNYLYKKSITIDHTKVSGGSDLSNFPVLISLTDPDLKTAANGGHVQNSNGYDIIFTNSTQKVRLDHEIEKYDALTGEIEIWVRIPTLSASMDTVIYMYFDNNSVVGPQENKTGVWDGNFQSVWHMGDNAASTTVKESTSNANNGAAQGNTTNNMTTTGKIDGALSFNGSSDYVSASSVTGLQGDNSRTVSMWIKTGTTTQQTFFDSGELTTNHEFILGLTQQNGTIYYNPPVNTPGVYLACFLRDVYIPGQTLTDNNWHHIVVTLSGTSVYMYIDGTTPQGCVLNGISWSSLTSQPFTLPSALNTTANPVWIGHSRVTISNVGSSYFTGSLDEIKISNTKRSSGWIITEYNNQSSPSTFRRVSSLMSR